MPIRILVVLVVAFFTACTPNQVIQPTSAISTEPSRPSVAVESAPPEATTTAVATSPASYKVAAFYYPWYGNPETDGKWIHWDQNNHIPPDDIGADFYPALGAYSSRDPAVVNRHMEWLQQAGIGVIITSWWGQGSREDQAVPLLLQTAEEYGIKVAFHIEPYTDRTADTLVDDIGYLYEMYGSSPAFFRSEATSRYSPKPGSTGMFFVWNIGTQGAAGERVEADYWRQAMDSIHMRSEGALIIANTTNGSWVEGGHFDGLYNYATLHLEESGGFDWARSLPPDSLYVPSVIPGFSAKRVGYADRTYVPRENGDTYETQWTRALGTGVEPAMVTITSFNEWHEGTMIEPPQFGVDDTTGYTYTDFETYSSEGYLSHTRDWIDRYLTRTWPRAYRMRIQVSTTSDWTTLDMLDNGAWRRPVWIRPELVSASDSATAAQFETGERLLLTQSLADALAGKEVEMTWDVMMTPGSKSTADDLVLQIDRGDIGNTRVTIFNYLGESPLEVGHFEWDQVTSERNSHQIAIPLAVLTSPNP